MFFSLAALTHTLLPTENIVHAKAQVCNILYLYSLLLVGSPDFPAALCFQQWGTSTDSLIKSKEQI